MVDINKIPEADKEEQKGDNESFEESQTFNKPKFFKNKKIIIFAGVVITAILALFIIKQIFLPPPPNNIIFPKKLLQTKPVINKTSNFLSTVKELSQKTGKSIKSTVPIVKKTKRNKKNLIKPNVKTINKNDIAFKVPSISTESMKSMLKFNAEINTLTQKAKIAQLKQQIKTLNKQGFNSPGPGESQAQSVSLIAITKNTALIAFGKQNVSMTVGMKYGGYTCLMIKNNSVVLERNNRTINLSLSV